MVIYCLLKYVKSPVNKTRIAYFCMNSNASAMNKSNIRVITIMASLALIGLIAIQAYWVDNAITLSKDRFEQSVNEALNNVVYRLEKHMAAARITKKFNFRKQGIRFFSPSDSLKPSNSFIEESLRD